MSAHVVDRLSAYLDGELTVADAAAVRQHLAACPACGEELAVLGAVDRRLREHAPSAPPGYFDSFSARVRGRIEADRAPRRALSLPAWTWAVAAALLLAVVLPRIPWDEARLPAAPTERTAPQSATARTMATPAAAPSEEEQPREAPAAASPGLLRDRDRHRTSSAPAAVRPAASPTAPATAPAPGFARVPAAPPPTTVARPQAKLEAEAKLAEELVIAARPDSHEPAKELRSPAKAEAYGVDRLTKRDDGPTEADSPDASAQAAAGAAAPHQVEQGGRTAPSMVNIAPKKARASELERLRGQPASSLEEARALRESLRSFVSRHPGTPEATEARVQIVALGVDIAARTGSTQDAEEARRDGELALAHGDARQKQRVRSLLGEPPRD